MIRERSKLGQTNLVSGLW